MIRKILKGVLRCGVAAGLLAGITSCADQRAPINLDITNRFYVEAVETPTPWGLSIWGCHLETMLNGTATYGCDPTEATVRLSFLKVEFDRSSRNPPR